MSVLQGICDQKRAHVAAQKDKVPLETLKARIKTQTPPRGFVKRINHVAQHDSPALITEIKKASPSKGLIREDFDPASIAQIYEGAGCACISVLTDTPYFQGTDTHFAAARTAVNVPMIRKDFMVDEYQILESRSMGADCILLIMAALDDDEAKTLYNLAIELGMDVLVEIHNAQELERSLMLPLAPDSTMIGVNNRNLKTLNVDVQTSFDLSPNIPKNITAIAESGLSDFQTLKDLQAVGYQGFLIGESLMRQSDIARAVKKIRENI